MSLTLTVDGPLWRSHLRSVADANPGLVPVAKGNGYGFGLGPLARRSAWLGVDTLAVGTYDELPEVASRFPGSLLVLTPFRPFSTLPSVSPDRLIHTVSRASDLVVLLAHEPRARYVLELATSMLRHGLDRGALLSLGALSGRCEGIALHLPLGTGSHLPEVERLINDVVGAGLAPATIWVSHLSDSELASLRSSYADFTFRPRIGTQLWLGCRSALQVTATVLDVHSVKRGDAFGYRGRTAPRAGHVVVVSGGTAHGIGLSAPNGASTLRARAATMARGGLDAAGFVRSPYTIDGQQRLFAEPPHMQASMLYLPGGVQAPEIGDDVAVRVRFTTTKFDHITLT